MRWLPFRSGMTPDDTHRGRMIMGIAEIAGTVELEDVGPDALPPDGTDRDAAAAARLPVFAPPRQVPVRLLGGLASVAGAVLAGFLVVVPMVEAAFRAPPPPPPETVVVRVAEGAFATTCTAALDAWWPRITGWQVGSAGCAVAGHLPDEPVLPEPRAADRLGRPMVVWRHLVPERGRNSVLARSAADQMVAAWPHEARIDPDGLTLWRTASLPMTEASDSEIATAPDAEADPRAPRRALGRHARRRDPPSRPGFGSRSLRGPVAGRHARRRDPLPALHRCRASRHGGSSSPPPQATRSFSRPSASGTCPSPCLKQPREGRRDEPVSPCRVSQPVGESRSARQ